MGPCTWSSYTSQHSIDLLEICIKLFFHPKQIIENIFTCTKCSIFNSFHAFPCYYFPSTCAELWIVQETMLTKRLQAPAMSVSQAEETSRQFKVPLILFLPGILSGSIFEFLQAYISNEFSFIYIYSLILDLDY